MKLFCAVIKSFMSNNNTNIIKIDITTLCLRCTTVPYLISGNKTITVQNYIY